MAAEVFGDLAGLICRLEHVHEWRSRHIPKAHAGVEEAQGFEMANRCHLGAEQLLHQLPKTLQVEHIEVDVIDAECLDGHGFPRVDGTYRGVWHQFGMMPRGTWGCTSRCQSSSIFHARFGSRPLSRGVR